MNQKLEEMRQELEMYQRSIDSRIERQVDFGGELNERVCRQETLVSDLLKKSKLKPNLEGAKPEERFKTYDITLRKEGQAPNINLTI